MRRNLNWKKFAFALLFVTLTGIQNAEEKNLISVALDNEHIQTYRNRPGLWTLFNRESLNTLALKFETTVGEIAAINEGRLSAGSYIFVPMGERYHTSLLSKGQGRRILEIDTRKLLWPVETPSYTSRFGDRWGGLHTGLDMACARNTVVLAASDGEVIAAGWFGALGHAAAIRHADGIETWYGHNTVVLIKLGEKVVRGQAIALSGNTGRSTGPHVHFEVRFMEVFMNPEDFLQYGLETPDVVLREVAPMEGQNHLGESALVAPNDPAAANN